METKQNAVFVYLWTHMAQLQRFIGRNVKFLLSLSFSLSRFSLEMFLLQIVATLFLTCQSCFFHQHWHLWRRRRKSRKAQETRRCVLEWVGRQTDRQTDRQTIAVLPTFIDAMRVRGKHATTPRSLALNKRASRHLKSNNKYDLVSSACLSIDPIWVSPMRHSPTGNERKSHKPTVNIHHAVFGRLVLYRSIVRCNKI